MSKYPLKKDALEKAKLELKKSKKAYNDTEREQKKIRREIEKANPVTDNIFYNEYRRKSKEAQDKQNDAVRLHKGKMKRTLAPLLKEERKAQLIIDKHHNAKYEAKRHKRKIREAANAERAKNRKDEQAVRREKKANYTDEQRTFMEKDRMSFNRTKKTFIMYKKAYLKDSDGFQCTPVIVTMTIPSKTGRVCSDSYDQSSNIMSRAKIRVAEAVVTHIHHLHGCDMGEETDRCAYAAHDKSFSYKKGATVQPKNDFDPDKSCVCASGIHGYLGIPATIDHS